MGRKPIPFSEIAAYSDWIGLDCPVERARLVKVVMAMNIAERTIHAKKAGK